MCRERGVGLDQDQTLQKGSCRTKSREIVVFGPLVRNSWCGLMSRSRASSAHDWRLPRDPPLLLAVTVCLPRCVAPGWRSRASNRPLQTCQTKYTEFCIVAAVRGPDEAFAGPGGRGHEAIRNEVDRSPAPLGMLTQEQVDRPQEQWAHRYNHNLETAQSFFPQRRPPTRGRAPGTPDGPRGGTVYAPRRHPRHGGDT